MTVAKQLKTFPSDIWLALAGFIEAGICLVIIIPRSDFGRYAEWIGTDERRLKLGVTAYGLFTLTALLLWFARRVLKLPLSWFFYALLFNGLLIFIKFISSPNTYSDLANQTLILTALGVGLLYIAGVALIYLFSRGKILKSLSQKSKSSDEEKYLFAAGLFVVINFFRLVIFSLPPLANTPTADYLSSIFQGGGLVLSIILFLIIVGAVQAFDRAKSKVAALGHTFVLAVSMIIIYHGLWVIFVNGLGACNCQ
jgi:hypothetical protein